MPKGLIVKALSGYYYVEEEGKRGGKTVQCRARGIFKKKGVSPLVGDRVVYSFTENGEGVVDEIEPRESELIRPPIANVSLAALVFSVTEPEPEHAPAGQVLVHIEHAEVEAAILLTKWDLLDRHPEEAAARMARRMEELIALYRRIGYEVIATSAKGGFGYQGVADRLADQISVFAGQSGVGKSSLERDAPWGVIGDEPD